MPRATIAAEDYGDSSSSVRTRWSPAGGGAAAGPPNGHPTDIQLHWGWRIRHLGTGAGRRVIEIYDASRELIALVASTTRPLVSIDSAWRGYHADDLGEPHWWALAIGHAHRKSCPLVTFGSRSPGGQVRRVTVTPDVIGGLWVAAVPGRRATVSLRQGPDWRIRGISPTYRGRP